MVCKRDGERDRETETDRQADRQVGITHAERQIQRKRVGVGSNVLTLIKTYHKCRQYMYLDPVSIADMVPQPERTESGHRHTGASHALRLGPFGQSGQSRPVIT